MLFRNAKGDTNLTIGTLECLRTRPKDIALSTFREFNDSHHKNKNLSKEEFECLKQLSINKDIVIKKSDKGNSIVILNKSDYFDKVKDILSDTKKFKKANIKPGKEIRYILNLEKKFKIILNDLLTKKKISTSEFEKLNPVGSWPGILYGLSKVHKPLANWLPKMRPILPAIGTATYNLAKFLVPILNSIANGPFSINNSFEFNKELLDQDASLSMGSLDVDALFTSIPLDETISIGVEELFRNSNEVQKLSKNKCIISLIWPLKSPYLFSMEIIITKLMVWQWDLP